MTETTTLDPEAPSRPSFVSGVGHRVRVVARAWTPVLVDMDGYNVVNAHNLGLLADLAYRGGWGQTLSRDGWAEDGSAAAVIADALRPLAERNASRAAVGDALTFAADPVLRRVEAPDALGLDTVRFFSSPGHSQAFGVASASHVVLGFRGSESPLSPGVVDWIRNANFLGVDYDWAGPGKVHKGFRDGFVAVRDQVNAFLSQFWAEGTPIFVCGHSLGGALATVAATYLRTRWRARVLLYTYASPHVGDAPFANHFSNDGDLVAHRHVLHSDIVPRLPPAELPTVASDLAQSVAGATALFVDANLDPWKHVGTLRYLEHIGDGAVVSRQLGTAAGPLPPPGAPPARSPDAMGWEMGAWGARATYSEVIGSVYGELQAQAQSATRAVGDAVGGALREATRRTREAIESDLHYGLDHMMGAYQEVLVHQLREAACDYLGLDAPSDVATQRHARWREAQAAAAAELADAEARERGAVAHARRLRSEAFAERNPLRQEPGTVAADNTAVVRLDPVIAPPRPPRPAQIHAPGGRVAPPPDVPPQRLSDLLAQREREEAAARAQRAAVLEAEAAEYERAAAAYGDAAADARQRRDEARRYAEGALREHGAVRGYDPIEGFREEIERHAAP